MPFNEPQPGFLAGKKTHVFAILTLLGIWAAFALGVEVFEQQPMTFSQAVMASIPVIFAMLFRSAMKTESVKVILPPDSSEAPTQIMQQGSARVSRDPPYNRGGEIPHSEVSRTGGTLRVLAFLLLIPMALIGCGCYPTSAGYISADAVDPALPDTLDRFNYLLDNTDVYSPDEELAYRTTSDGLRLVFEGAKRSGKLVAPIRPAPAPMPEPIPEEPPAPVE